MLQTVTAPADAATPDATSTATSPAPDAAATPDTTATATPAPDANTTATPVPTAASNTTTNDSSMVIAPLISPAPSQATTVLSLQQSRYCSWGLVADSTSTTLVCPGASGNSSSSWWVPVTVANLPSAVADFSAAPISAAPQMLMPGPNATMVSGMRHMCAHVLSWMHLCWVVIFGRRCCRISALLRYRVDC